MADPLSGMYEWGPATLDGPAEVAKAMRETRRHVILRFASAASRDAAFTAAGVNPDGCVCRLASNPTALYFHRLGRWSTYGEGARQFVAQTLGGSLNLGAQGVTSIISVPAGDSNRVVNIASGFLITSQTQTSSEVDINLYVNGQAEKAARGTGYQFSLSVNHTRALAAGSAMTLQLVMTRSSGSGTAVATSDSRFTYLNAIVHGAT